MYIWIFHGKGLQIKVVIIQFMIGKSGNKVVSNQKLFTVFGKSVKKKTTKIHYSANHPKSLVLMAKQYRLNFQKNVRLKTNSKVFIISKQLVF